MSSVPNLGIYAKSSSAPQIDPETGEIFGEGWSYSAALVERYALQAQARRSMLEAHRLDSAGEKKPHAVTRCRRWFRPRGKFGRVYAEVYRHRDTGRTHYGGLEVCASSWACPVCAAKIAERRAVEIRAAVDQWISSGGVCFFITLTVPHDDRDQLGPMVQSLRRAFELFRSGRPFARLAAMMGYSGIIRALEITWGEGNGWHPHSHEIWFCRPEAFPLDQLARRWQDSAEAAGFRRPSDAHGFNWQVCRSTEQAAKLLADYLTKVGAPQEDARPLWGVAEELTRAHTKRGRGRRFTPWDFLRSQFDEEATTAQRVRYRRLFAEYVREFKGLAQVFWSRGLKKRFDLADLTDQVIADQSREPADRLSDIEESDWRKVLYRADHRASLLLLAQSGGDNAIRAFLDGLPSPPPRALPPS